MLCTCTHILYSLLSSLDYFQGSIEFMRDYTSIDFPFVLYNAHTEEFQYSRYFIYARRVCRNIKTLSNSLCCHYLYWYFPPNIVLSIFHVIYLISLSGNGIIMMIIDNLPAQLPRESTDYFGSRLLPFITDLVSL